MFLAGKGKERKTDSMKSVPYLAEQRRTTYNKRSASGCALARYDEIVEKDRWSRWVDHRGSEDRRKGGIRDRAQADKELETKIIGFPKR